MAEASLQHAVFRLLELLSNEHSNWANLHGFTDEKIPYRKIEAVDYQYHDISVKVKDVFYLKSYLKLNDYTEFLESIIATSQYVDSVDCLVEKYDLTQEKATEYLGRFIDKSCRILNEDSADFSNEAFIQKFVQTFINEIVKKPIDYNFRIYLEGILLKKDIYLLKNTVLGDMVLRWPDLEDFSLETKYYPEYFYHDDEIPVRSTAVLEFVAPCKGDDDAHNVTENIYNILLLHRVTSVIKLQVDQEIKYSFNPFTPFLMKTNSLYKILPNIRHEYTEEEIEQLPGIIEHLYPNIGLVSTRSNKKLVSNELGYLEYAFIMYREALLQRASTRIRIAFAITALETLYRVKDESRMRDGKKVYNYKLVGERAESLLKSVNYPAEAIFTTIDNAYKIRDAVYHGFELKPDLVQNETKIYRLLLDCLRVSLQVFIQLKLPKAYLLRQIDHLSGGKAQHCDKDFRASLREKIIVT